MPLPSSINDLTTSESTNSPAGTESPQTFDNYLRWHASFIAALRDVVLSGAGNLSTANLAYSGTLTGSTGVMNIGAGQIYKDASGNVGVGVTPSGAKLHIYDGSTPTQIKVESASTSDAILRFSNGATGALAGVYANNAQALVLEAGGATERMRIDSSGGVLIGVTSQSFGGGGITSRGDVGVHTRTSAGASTGIALAVTRESATGELVRFTVSNSSTGQGQTRYDAGILTLQADSTNALALGTAGAARVQIDSSGNVSIANSASAPGTPASGGVLYVEAGALKFRGSSGTITTIAAA